MKIIASAGRVLASVLLVGCSGTPDCADSDTLDLIDQIVTKAAKAQVAHYEGSELAQKYWDLFDVDSFREIPDKYEVSKIRLLNYDKDTDAYECEATIDYHYKDYRPRTFHYRVETDQSDSEPLLSYDSHEMLGPAF